MTSPPQLPVPQWRKSLVDGWNHAWPLPGDPSATWTAVCSATASGDQLADKPAPTCMACALTVGNFIADRLGNQVHRLDPTVAPADPEG